jgi:hypothetical protein
MESIREQSAVDTPSLATELAAYLALAFGFSWLMWVGAIKLGLGEEYLNIGTAGPALAAIILSRSRQPQKTHLLTRRWLWMIALLLPCWIVLSLHYLWRSSDGLPFRLNPLLLIPALFPAWVLSEILAADEGAQSAAAFAASTAPLVPLCVVVLSAPPGYTVSDSSCVWRPACLA